MEKIVECVPNFSEGRDKEIIDAIANAIRSAPGCTLLDVDPGVSTNRTVYTFVGDPSAVIQGALSAAKIASSLIDMSLHTGEHPRLGAMDVCPFIPVRGVTMEDCADCARQLGALLAEALDIPVFLYGAAAKREYRKTVPQIRAGEYEGLERKLSDDRWRPDYGPCEFRPRWGASMVGARSFLIAYNINLISTKEQAHRIALNVREQGRGPAQPGRLRCVQGLGWWLEEAQIAQVSLNLLDHEQTPIHEAYEEVCRDAKELNLPVVGSEIVGLVPLKAILQAAKFYMERDNLFVLEEDQQVRLVISRLGLSSLQPFIPRERIIEYRLPGSGKAGPLARLTVETFVSSVGARTPAPGGGSVAALLGALGAALGTMVGQMTYGKRQFEEYDTIMRRLIPKVHSVMKELVPFIDADTSAFAKYMEALKLPKRTEEEELARNNALQEALCGAVKVPLSMAQTANRLWPSLRELATVCNLGTASDLQVGARCLETAAWGAFYNVHINLRDLQDTTLKEQFFSAAKQAVESAEQGCAAVLEVMEKRLNSSSKS
ncbi:formimidoyltransferase-cyclodeaminase [Anabrus simplex]|uniref:formimidoyltransferase-cyclodeaminase n=1 Tax=Anabrus simplex TaxID=316456 RepID=UPI0035A3B62E